MNNINITTLDDLIKEKREKKKKAPTAQDSKQFRDAWTGLIINEGFTKRVERYLYEGFFFCGAEPFESYLCQAKEPDEVLTSFFAGNMYGADMSATFRLLSHLLALLLNDGAPQNILAPIIKRLPNASLNKEKKRLGTAEKTMEKYFFAELKHDVELLPLEKLELKPIFIDDFSKMMASIINGMQSDDSSNIAKVQAWITSYAETLEELAVSSSTKTETNKPTLQVAREKQTPLLISPPSQNITNTEKNHEVVDLKIYLMDLLNQVGETASAISSESIQHKNKAAELTRSLSSEKEKLRHANQQLTEQLETISVLRQKLAAAAEDVLILKQNITQKDALIAEKEAEIAERIKMSDVLSRDRSKQVDEVLQRMASKIGVEYRDFQDAIAAPMNCDLGENLRLQLQSIFDILEKGGMKIK